MYCKKILTSLLMAAFLLCSCAMSVGSSRYTVGTSGEAKVWSAAALAVEGVNGGRRTAGRSLGRKVPAKAPPPPKPNNSTGAKPLRPPAPPPPCPPVADARFG